MFIIKSEYVFSQFKCRKTMIIANMLSYAAQKCLGIMPPAALCRIIQLDTEPAL